MKNIAWTFVAAGLLFGCGDDDGALDAATDAVASDTAAPTDASADEGTDAYVELTPDELCTRWNALGVECDGVPYIPGDCAAIVACQRSISTSEYNEAESACVASAEDCGRADECAGILMQPLAVTNEYISGCIARRDECALEDVDTGCADNSTRLSAAAAERATACLALPCAEVNACTLALDTCTE